MGFVVAGIIMVFGDAVAVKLFDDIIRPRMYAKAIVNTVMIVGLLCFFGGIIALAVG